MSRVIDRDVTVKQYTLTLDEQEYEILRDAIEFIESVATKKWMEDRSLAWVENEAQRIVGGIGLKVLGARPEELPDWWPEDQKWHLSEEHLTSEQIVELARENHIWVNAFSSINPRPEVLQDIGRSVLNMLNASHLRTVGFGEPDSKGRKAAESPLVYIRVNKS